MSRTYRLKNWEQTKQTSWDRKFRKLFGTKNLVYTNDKTDHLAYWITYVRKPTEWEDLVLYNKLHSDTKQGRLNVKRTYAKKLYTKLVRNRNKIQLSKYMKDNGYEMMAIDKLPTNYLYLSEG